MDMWQVVKLMGLRLTPVAELIGAARFSDVPGTPPEAATRDECREFVHAG
jgi:hypothetical protein